MKLSRVLGLVSLGACAALYLGCSSSTPAASSSSGGTSDAAADVKTDAPKRDGGGGDGGVACFNAAEAGVFATTKATAKQGLCSAGQIKGFFDDCLGSMSSEAACKAFDDNVANAECNKCLTGPRNGDDVTKYSEPALIEAGTSIYINTGACAGLAAGDVACAKKLSDEGTCLITSCAECADADVDACNDTAAAEVCKPYLAGKACEDAVKAKQAAVDAQCDAADFDALYNKVVPYICGVP